MRTILSCMETRASSCINSFIFVVCYKQRIISVNEDTKEHNNENKTLACKVFHRMASLIKCNKQ